VNTAGADASVRSLTGAVATLLGLPEPTGGAGAGEGAGAGAGEGAGAGVAQAATGDKASGAVHRLSISADGSIAVAAAGDDHTAARRTATHPLSSAPFCASHVPAACVAAHRLAAGVRHAAELCDALHVSQHGTTADARSLLAASDNLIVPRAVVERMQRVYSLIAAATRVLAAQHAPSNLGDGEGAAERGGGPAGGASAASAQGMRTLLEAAAIAQAEAAALRMHPSIRYDHFIPLMHRLAVLLPPWAPVTMPMLLAVIIGVAQVLRKLRRRSGPGGAPGAVGAASLSAAAAAQSAAAVASSQSGLRAAASHGGAVTMQTPRGAGIAASAGAAAATPSDARSVASGATSPSGGAAAQPSRGSGGGSSGSGNSAIKRVSGVTSPSGSSRRSRGASGAQSPLAGAASAVAQLPPSPASLRHAAEDAYAGAKQYTLRLRQARGDAAVASAPSPSGGGGIVSSIGSSDGPSDGPSDRDGSAAAQLTVSIRALRPGDASALQRLYAVGQEQHMRDEASARAHARWTRGVLAGDLSDPYDTYVAGEQRVLYPGKACFWVATVSRDDFDRCAVRSGASVGNAVGAGGISGSLSPGGRSPAPEASPTGCLDSVQCVPSAAAYGSGAGSSIVIAGSSTEAPAWGKRTILAAADTLDSDGRVIIGCVAVTPYCSEEAKADAPGTAPSASKTANAATGELQPSRYSDGPIAADAGASPVAPPAEEPRIAAAKRLTATGELTRMCVHPAIQRCGLASTLLSHLQTWCSEEGRGYDRVYLSTLATMRPAVRLYTANGFSFVPGCPPDGHREDYCGDVLQVVEMHKALR